MTNMQSITPCPFCGGAGVPSARPRGIVVRCKNRDTTCPVNMRTHHRNSVEDAVADWNTRAALPDTKALEMADGRPCETDIFLVCLFDQVEDHYDREAAIKDWLEGAWSEALDGVELPDRAAREGKA